MIGGGLGADGVRRVWGVCGDGEVLEMTVEGVCVEGGGGIRAASYKQ